MSRIPSSKFFLQIKRLTCVQQVLSIFEEWSVNKYSDESRWCFRGWFRASGILVRMRANSSQRITATLHPTQCGGEGYNKVTLWSAFFINQDISIISCRIIMHIVCWKSLAEGRRCLLSSLQSPRWALYYTTSTRHCELYLCSSLRAADNEGRSS